MHSQRPNQIRNRVLGLGLLAALLTWLTPAVAQPPGAAPPTPGGESTEQVITVGQSIILQHQSGKDIKRVIVAHPGVLKVEVIDPMNPSIVRATGENVGSTTVTLYSTDAGTNATTIAIRVEPDLRMIQATLSQQFPRTNLKVSPGSERTLIVTGTVNSSEDVQPVLNLLRGYARNVINGIRVAGVMQVQLECCVARVDRTELRRMGFNWFQADQQNFYGSRIGNVIGRPDITLRGNVGTFTGDEILSDSANLFFGLTDRTSVFLGFLEALRQEKIAKILANPILVTMSGTPADFLVGGEQPYPVPATIGQAPGIVFRPFGTQLSFVPIVLGDGKIRLEVRPEVSRLNFANGILIAGSEVPQIELQRYHGTVEMENGQTLAIGGLLQNVIDAQTDKVPCLGDLPFVGTLFRRLHYEEHETELLILVTARLVDPLDCSQRTTKLPGQETRSPTDFELFLEGILEAPRGPRDICVDGCYRPAHFWDSCSACCGGNGKGGHHGSCNGGCANSDGTTMMAPPQGEVRVEMPAAPESPVKAASPAKTAPATPAKPATRVELKSVSATELPPLPKSVDLKPPKEEGVSVIVPELP